MVYRNPLKGAWEEGGTAFGLWATMPGSFEAELLAGAGADYVCVDQQHGLLDYDAMVPMLQGIGAAGAAPLTRVLRNEAFGIMKSLDAGALGVIVPMVDDAEGAASAVAACRYPPRGIRSYGPVRAGAVLGKEPDDLEREVLCFVMVETREGLENVEEIAATPGLDGIYVGPADLALALGLAPTLEPSEPKHLEAISRIRKACEDNGRIAGIHCGSGEWARKHAGDGFRLVSAATDSSLLSLAARREVLEARGSGPGGAL